MKQETDIVESLIRSAGRRVEPPPDAYQSVFVAAHAAFLEKSARRRGRVRGLWASAAAAIVCAVAVLVLWSPPAARQTELARVERILGDVEVATGDAWRPAAEAGLGLVAGTRIRTRNSARTALALAGGESLRLDSDTEVMLDAPGRLYLRHGTIYVDSGARPADARVEVVTPGGTARDLGTQFELHVVATALRLRVREGTVTIDRGGSTLIGKAGEELSIDGLGGVLRAPISPSDPAWQWAETIAQMPDIDGRPAAALISWVARETGRHLRYESPLVEQRAESVILHGEVRHLAPFEALEAMLATTDLTFELRGDTMEIRARSQEPPGP